MKGSGSGSMKNPPIRPSAFVGLETTQHPADPRTLKPVQGLTEYVPIYSGAFLPAEHQLDLVTMDDEGNTNLQLNLYNGQLVLEAPNAYCRIDLVGRFTSSVSIPVPYEDPHTMRRPC